MSSISIIALPERGEIGVSIWSYLIKFIKSYNKLYLIFYWFVDFLTDWNFDSSICIYIPLYIFEIMNLSSRFIY